MRKPFTSAVAALSVGVLLCLCAAAQTVAPSARREFRRVEGQALVSDTMPAVKIEFDKKFRYVGGHSFKLYDVARAEQHFFVDADGKCRGVKNPLYRCERVKRLYWVQFEGYLPNNEHAYDYKGDKSVQLGGLDFIADAYPRNIKADPGRPDSDGARARAFLEARGFQLAGDDILMQRLVHLVDDAKRNELMIIYIEDLGRTGLVAADLAEGGRAAARWPEFSKALLERAVSGMKISR